MEHIRAYIAALNSAMDILAEAADASVADLTAAGMPDGSYQLGPQAVTVQDGVARLSGGDAIAGGTSHLLDQVRLLTQGGYVPVVDAVYMASVQGAKILGDKTIGCLREGMKADVVVVSDSLEPVTVYRRGVAV